MSPDALAAVAAGGVTAQQMRDAGFNITNKEFQDWTLGPTTPGLGRMLGSLNFSYRSMNYPAATSLLGGSSGITKPEELSLIQRVSLETTEALTKMPWWPMTATVAGGVGKGMEYINEYYAKPWAASLGGLIQGYGDMYRRGRTEAFTSPTPYTVAFLEPYIRTAAEISQQGRGYVTPADFFKAQARFGQATLPGGAIRREYEEWPVNPIAKVALESSAYVPLAVAGGLAAGVRVPAVTRGQVGSYIRGMFTPQLTPQGVPRFGGPTLLKYMAGTGVIYGGSAIASVVRGSQIPVRQADLAALESVKNMSDWEKMRYASIIQTLSDKSVADEFLPEGKEGKGVVDYDTLVKVMGNEERAAMALAAASSISEEPQKFTIDKNVYAQLSPQAQQFYQPSAYATAAYQEGLLGTYRRGAEALGAPITRLEQSGFLGQLGGGFLRYQFMPHLTVSELYNTKGPISFIATIPHFGQTWGTTALTWNEQPWYGKALGIGFGALPLVAGPLSSLMPKVRMPSPIAKVNTAFKYATYPIMKLGEGPPRLKWSMPMETQLAKLPGIGAAGEKWGWWSPTRVNTPLFNPNLARNPETIIKTKEGNVPIRELLKWNNEFGIEQTEFKFGRNATLRVFGQEPYAKLSLQASGKLQTPSLLSPEKASAKSITAQAQTEGLSLIYEKTYGQKAGTQTYTIDATTGKMKGYIEVAGKRVNVTGLTPKEVFGSAYDYPSLRQSERMRMLIESRLGGAKEVQIGEPSSSFDIIDELYTRAEAKYAKMPDTIIKTTTGEVLGKPITVTNEVPNLAKQRLMTQYVQTELAKLPSRNMPYSRYFMTPAQVSSMRVSTAGATAGVYGEAAYGLPQYMGGKTSILASYAEVVNAAPITQAARAALSKFGWSLPGLFRTGTPTTIPMGTPAPVPTPTPSPTPIPSVSPAMTPIEQAAMASQSMAITTPTETPSLVTTPISMPTPEPTPVPKPTPTPIPRSTPSPIPRPIPNPLPSPIPVPVPTPTPTPTPTEVSTSTEVAEEGQGKGEGKGEGEIPPFWPFGLGAAGGIGGGFGLPRISPVGMFTFNLSVTAPHPLEQRVVRSRVKLRRRYGAVPVHRRNNGSGIIATRTLGSGPATTGRVYKPSFGGL